ncbi:MULTISPECIES: hypothetical protein [unclassified Thiocapsa]|uniref:hypothetical protein n=1 Tax=unclassified Thiocapsa TaxID=2641286 RepID=UPI0035AE4EEE
MDTAIVCVHSGKRARYGKTNTGTRDRRLDGQHRHVAMPWRLAGLGQPGDGNAEHDQAFQRTRAHRLIDDENPIVAPRQGFEWLNAMLGQVLTIGWPKPS